MNNHLSYLLLLLVTLQIVPAANTTYDFCSYEPHPIKLLEEEHRALWSCIYAAINDNCLRSFKKSINKELINKAKFTRNWYGSNEYIDAQTLIEVIIKYEETDDRAQMLQLLLEHGAYTRSIYTISCKKPPYIKPHYAPIFTAILKGNIKAFEQLWLADHTVPCEAEICKWFPEEEAKTTPADTELNEFIMIDGSFEDLSQDPIHPILELWASPEKKIHDPFLAEHGFVIVDGTADKIPHEKSIQGFLMLLKDMIENPKKYPKGTPMQYPERQPYMLPTLYAVHSMLNITQTEPQTGIYSTLAKSFSDLSSFLFWK